MKQKLMIPILALFLIGASSCGKDKVNCNSYEQVLTNEFAQIFASALAFGLDPSPSNCNNYKKALNSYLDVLEDYKDCAPTAAEREDLEFEIDETRKDINELGC